MDPRPRILSLFSGVGGLDLGIELALPSAIPVCFVEREIYAAAVLAARMEEGAMARAPVWSDVTTFDGTAWRGAVDLICGGFPCQDLSVAGKQAGIREGKRSGLWGEFARIIGEVGPRFVFVENVRGLAGDGLSVVLSDLADLGFDAEWSLLSAGACGAPHRRERVFILAVSERSRRGQVEQPRRAGEAAEPFGPGGEQVADPRDGLVPEPGRGPEGRDGAGSAGEVGDEGRRLDDPLRGRHGQPDEAIRAGRDGALGTGLPLFPPGPGDLPGWRAVLEEWPELAPAVGNAADRERGGIEEEAGSGEKPEPRESSSGTAHAHAPEPPLRLVADGLALALAHRVDALRACGNGVVPIQAACAFVALTRRAGVAEELGIGPPVAPEA